VIRACGREFEYQCDTGSRGTLHVSRNCFAITHKRDRPRQPYRPVRRDLHAHLAAGHLHGDGADAAAGADGRLNTLIYVLVNLRFLQRLRRNPALNVQLRIVENKDKRGIHVDWGGATGAPI
jgi:hypothetical protein